MRTLIACLGLAALPAAPVAAGQAQGGGFGRNSQIPWQDSMDRVAVAGPGGLPGAPGPRPPGKKYILVFVKPAADDREPHDFANAEVVAASRGDWTFVWMNRDPENPWQKHWGVSRAPSCLGCDLRGNAFHLGTSTSILALRTLLHAVPDSIARYEARLKADFTRAIEALRQDETKGVRLLVEFVQKEAPAGYRQAEEATAVLQELGAKALKNAELAESVSPEKGIEYLEEIVRLYQGTPPGIAAEVRIARQENGRGNARAAVVRLQRIAAHDAAAKLLAEILEAARAGAPAAKAPEPPAAELSDALKEVRDAHKAEFARRAPEDFRALARKLLGLGLVTGDRPAARFVLLREARELAVQAGDVELALEAVDAAAAYFTMDAVALKAAALAKLSPRTPQGARALAEAHLGLVEEALALDQYEAADTAAGRAEAAVRTAQDPALAAHVQSIQKEISWLQKAHGLAKPSIALLAQKPEDPAANLAAGAFYALLKGDWGKGLPLLARGSDEPLKAAAARDLAGPSDATEQVAVADAWWALHEKESVAERKLRMRDRARHWYETALPKSAGVQKALVETRLAQMPPPLPVRGARAPVDLLRLVDLRQDALGRPEAWQAGETGLVSLRGAVLQLPMVPPDEYDLTVVAERKGPNPGALRLGLSAGGSQFMVVLGDRQDTVSEIGLVDGNFGSRISNPPPGDQLAWKGAVFGPNKTVTVTCSVRRSLFLVKVDGATILSWKADYGRASNPRGWRTPNDKALYLAPEAEFRIARMTLLPVSGRPKPLR